MEGYERVINEIRRFRARALRIVGVARHDELSGFLTQLLEAQVAILQQPLRVTLRTPLSYALGDDAIQRGHWGRVKCRVPKAGVLTDVTGGPRRPNPGEDAVTVAIRCQRHDVLPYSHSLPLCTRGPSCGRYSAFLPSPA